MQRNASFLCQMIISVDKRIETAGKTRSSITSFLGCKVHAFQFDELDVARMMNDIMANAGKPADLN